MPAAGKRRLVLESLKYRRCLFKRGDNQRRCEDLPSPTLTGAAHLEEYKKDKRVHRASSGFWYRIDSDTVDVAVKETRVDGTVLRGEQHPPAVSGYRAAARAGIGVYRPGLAPAPG